MAVRHIFTDTTKVKDLNGKIYNTPTYDIMDRIVIIGYVVIVGVLTVLLIFKIFNGFFE